MVRRIVIMTTINKEVIDAFVSTLQDLTINSKPLINVLTMIADENEAYSKNIVEAIETHLSKVRLEVKLPILYLIDCIIKNVGRSYTQHFCQNVVSTFCGVFEVVDEKTRAEMFKLRQTWNDVLPKARLYAMDVQIRKIDPAWPITTHLHSITTTANTIHVNPRFLSTNALKKDQQQSMAKGGTLMMPAVGTPQNPETLVMQQKLLSKQKELVELQQKKIELELLQTKVKLEEEKLKSQLVSSKSTKTDGVLPLTMKSHNILLKPEVAKQLNNGSDDTIKPNSNTHSLYPSIAQQSYTIPKHQQTSRYVAVSVNRDPRLLRVQHQPHDPTATNTRTPPDLKKGAGNNSRILKPTGRLPNKPTNINNKRPGKGIKPSTTDPISKIPKKRIVPSPAHVDVQAQQEQQKIASSKNANSPKSVFNTSASSESTSSGASPTKQKQDEAEEDGDGAAGGGKFRDLKGVNKRRNYVRRNNSRLLNEEQGRVKEVEVGDGDGGGGSGGGDVDLRSLDSFGVVASGGAVNSKLNQSAKLDVAQKGGDVDLRQIPTSSAEKKRSSNSDSADLPPSKKSKSQMLDALFGSEDVDLRQSSVPSSTAERASTPPPPPPPIISSAKSADQHDDEQMQLQPIQTVAVASADSKDLKKANLDALRAKLASVSNKEKLKEQKRKQTKEQKQQDIVETTSTAVSGVAETVESAIIRKIIMSSDDVDSIKAGKLSKEQEHAIMAKIKSHFENEKLAQAKLKEQEEREDQQMQQGQPDPEMSDDDEVVEVLPTSSQSNDPPVSSAGGRFAPRTRGGSRIAHARTQQSGRTGSNRWGPATNTTWPQGKVGRWGATTNHITPPPPPPIPPLVDYNLIQQQEQQQAEGPQPILLQCTNPDDARSINIDGCPRDIRFYDQTAIVFMSWDDPREISFQHGARRAIFDESDAFLLQLNDADYTNVAISGQMHRIRLGGPTRELWIDGQHYEAIFGGKQVALQIDGRVAKVQLEGPPPQVRIGTERRLDLVAGKIQMIVDAKIIIPVFLDARAQQIVIGTGRMHRVQFVDRLRAVRFDGGPALPVEFGGLPKVVYLKQRKHFVRFSVLPRGIRPGAVRIQGMDGGAGADGAHMAFYEPPVTTVPRMPNAEELAGVPVAHAPVALVDESSLDSQHNLGGNFDALSNATNVSLNTSASEYHVESQLSSQHSTLPPPVTNAADCTVQQVEQPTLSNILNINDLFQKLIATGIVTTQRQTQERQANVEKQTPLPPQQQQHKAKGKETKTNLVVDEIPAPVLLPIHWNKPDSLKTRQTGLVQLLYSGLQCNSCGERFPPAAGGSRLFSQHLDWHFRQNRRGKTSARNRKATSRRWYYSLADWRQYEEIEDLKERAEKNFFENQQQLEDGSDLTAPSQDTLSDHHHHHHHGSSQAADLLCSVAADPDTTDPHCAVCEDRFEQFYNEELEEWHLRHAIAVDGQIYHPVCYKDQQSAVQASSIPGLDMMTAEPEAKEDVEMDGNSSVEEIQVIDDDEVEIKGKDDGTEADLELIGAVSAKEAEDREDSAVDGDDDVILNEVQPEQIILDEYQWRGAEPAEEDGLTLGGGLIPGVVVKIEPIDDGFMDVGDSLKKAHVIDESALTKADLPEAVATAETEATKHPETIAIDKDDHQQNNDPTEAVIIDEDVDMVVQTPQQHQAEQMIASIDGNIDLNNKVAPPGLMTTIGPVAALAPSGRIRINISKTHSKGGAPEPQKNSEQTDVFSCVGDVSVGVVDPTQPLPPGEEPPLKAALRGLALRRQAPVHTGTELTGLCSVM